MSELVFGIDGGQTSTKCVLATTDGQILARSSGGALTHTASKGGREKLVQSLREAFAQAWQAAGLAPREVEAVGLGLTGVEAGTVEAEIVRDSLPEILHARHVEIESDAFAALMGAHMGQPGVIAISGTGSIVLGMNAQGQRARAGGWGWLAGDEGSAFAIGRSGLVAAFHAVDGVGPPTLLDEFLLRHFNVSSLYDAKRLIVAPDFGQKGFASLAPLVSQAAQHGDTVAAGIIRQAGEALAAHVTAVVRRLDLNPAAVAPVGGAFEHVAGLLESFQAALSQAPVHTNVVSPKLPPVLGAVVMALKRSSVDWQSVAARLSQMQNGGSS